MHRTTRRVWLAISQGADMPISATSDNSPKLPEPSTSFAHSLFVYVKIPVVRDSIDQVHGREDAIDQILKEKGIGSVLGWGDSLGDTQPDGSRDVAFTRIDINVTDLAAARAILQAALAALGSPTGTEIHYTIEHQDLADLYAESGWLLTQPSRLGARHKLGSKAQP
jgi:hypothetical protein